MFTLVRSCELHTPPNARMFDFDASYPKESFRYDDPENSPMESILYYCSGIINESNMYNFSLNCVGYKKELLIRPELSIVLEQTAQVFHFLRDRSCGNTQIHLFEQACEMLITLERQDDNRILVTILDKTQLIKTSGIITEQPFTISMCHFVVDFISALSCLIPEVLTEMAFLQWFKSIAIVP